MAYVGYDPVCVPVRRVSALSIPRRPWPGNDWRMVAVSLLAWVGIIAAVRAIF
jgi:hypothetical protein